MKKLFAICLVVVLFSSGYAGVVDIYYDVDFSSPEHQVGFPPATGNSPTRPSRIVFGSPMVSTSLGALNDQPLVFNTTGNVPSFYYDQILFDVGKGQSYYYVAFDMFAQTLIGSRNYFAVIFDTPSVRPIVFKNDGKISFSGGYPNSIATFAENVVMHFDVYMDIIEHSWSISRNGSQIYTGPFNPDSDIKSVRFSLGLKSSDFQQDNSTFVGLDNIIVANAPIPEPATLLLLSLGGLFLRRKN